MIEGGQGEGEGGGEGDDRVVRARVRVEDERDGARKTPAEIERRCARASGRR